MAKVWTAKEMAKEHDLRKGYLKDLKGITKQTLSLVNDHFYHADKGYEECGFHISCTKYESGTLTKFYEELGYKATSEWNSIEYGDAVVHVSYKHLVDKGE